MLQGMVDGNDYKQAQWACGGEGLGFVPRQISPEPRWLISSDRELKQGVKDHDGFVRRALF